MLRTTTPLLSTDLYRHSRWRRILLWSALVGLLLVAQSLLVWLTLDFESNRSQEQTEAVASVSIGSIKHVLGRNLQNLYSLTWRDGGDTSTWRLKVADLLNKHRELMRVEHRNLRWQIKEVVESPFQAPIFSTIPRERFEFDAKIACANAKRSAAPTYSRSYYVPLPSGNGLEVMDICLPLQMAGKPAGFLVGTLALSRLLDEATSPDIARAYELSFVEGDGTRLTRAGATRGSGVFQASRLLDLPGVTLQLQVDSDQGKPRLIPNLNTALVLSLSLALGGVVILLVRDVRRRSRIEATLADALALRRAMENSLVTGLRARDLQGRITYVNPAFCRMVDFPAEDLLGQDSPPYWPPELVADYTQRQQVLLSGKGPSREGYESVFMRRNGERFTVMIFEAPLVDSQGHQTGWMSTTLDISAQRQVEELSRQQQEQLQATARLATMGEMASLLSHELNQPLSAIASYATGSLNLMADASEAASPPTQNQLQQALQRIAEQASRAGRVIKSVHDFVRRREQQREAMSVDDLIDSIMPLVRLQARKSTTRVELDLPAPMPCVVGDRTMLEQVLLNLTRNGIQSMEDHTPVDQRELLIRVRQTEDRWVTFSVIDHGSGVAPEVARHLFTPFFTTRSEGLGLGLSLCRTVIEQHGGVLELHPWSHQDSALTTAEHNSGTEFRFTLPAAIEEALQVEPSH